MVMVELAVVELAVIVHLLSVRTLAVAHQLNQS
jgi:hypothetical protein